MQNHNIAFCFSVGTKLAVLKVIGSVCLRTGWMLREYLYLTLHNAQHHQMLLDDYVWENGMDGTCSTHG